MIALNSMNSESKFQRVPKPGITNLTKLSDVSGHNIPFYLDQKGMNSVVYLLHMQSLHINPQVSK